jgi:hypothetical protein
MYANKTSPRILNEINYFASSASDLNSSFLCVILPFVSVLIGGISTSFQMRSVNILSLLLLDLLFSFIGNNKNLI